MESKVSPIISAKSQKMMEMLMMEPKIAEKVAGDYSHKIITICNDGTIILGKTSFYFWNNLIKCQKIIAFPIFALSVWKALLDLSDGETRLAIQKGLSQEILDKAIREQKYDEIIDRLIDVSRHACGPNILRSISTPNINDYKQENKKINVYINGIKQKLTVQDSIGDPFIDIDLEPTSCRFRGGK